MGFVAHMLRRMSHKVVCLSLVILNTPAFGQGYNSKDMDKFTLTSVSEDEALLEYYNSESMNSVANPRPMVGDGFTLYFILDITSGDETLTVLPSDGWIARPMSVSVADGDKGYIKIIRVIGY